MTFATVITLDVSGDIAGQANTDSVARALADFLSVPLERVVFTIATAASVRATYHVHAEGAHIAQRHATHLKRAPLAELSAELGVPLRASPVVSLAQMTSDGSLLSYPPAAPPLFEASPLPRPPAAPPLFEASLLPRAPAAPMEVAKVPLILTELGAPGNQSGFIELKNVALTSIDLSHGALHLACWALDGKLHAIDDLNSCGLIGAGQCCVLCEDNASFAVTFPQSQCAAPLLGCAGAAAQFALVHLPPYLLSLSPTTRAAAAPFDLLLHDVYGHVAPASRRLSHGVAPLFAGGHAMRIAGAVTPRGGALPTSPWVPSEWVVAVPASASLMHPGIWESASDLPGRPPQHPQPTSPPPPPPRPPTWPLPPASPPSPWRMADIDLFYVPLPIIQDVHPTQGGGGTLLSISGTGFCSNISQPPFNTIASCESAQVTLGDGLCRLIRVTDTEIECVVQPHKPATVGVNVLIPGLGNAAGIFDLCAEATSHEPCS